MTEKARDVKTERSQGTIDYVNTEYSWNGECQEGLAEGPGELQVTETGKTQEFSGELHETEPGKSWSNEHWYGWINSTIYRMNVHQGIPFGYIQIENEFKDLDKKRQDSLYDLEKESGRNLHKFIHYAFQFGNRLVEFHDLGLHVDESQWQNKEVMPTRTIALERFKSIYVTTNNKMEALTFMKGSCYGEKTKFPDCDNNSTNLGFDTYYFYHADFNLDGTTTFPAPDAPKIYCQNPKEIASCASFQGLKDIVNDVEAFIRDSLPKVKAMELAFKNERKEKPGRLAREDKEKSDQLAREDAAANLALDAQLNKKPLKGLFDLANEYRSNGDIVRARMALRKLIQRFPNNKLAAEAATMLTEMQGK